jgi:hypothetical protein
MSRLTLLLCLVAMVLRAAAAAGTQPTDAATRAALATERYYSTSTVRPQPVSAPVAPAEPGPSGHDGPSWLGAAGIGAALILLAGGLGAYGGRALSARGARA